MGPGKRSDTQTATAERPGRRLCDSDALFRRIASGDEGAFEQMFEAFRSRLISYLTRITKSTEVAKELNQEIFLKLWTNRASLAEIESPRHYIFMIARNKAVDYLRKAAVDARMRQRIWESISEYQESMEETVSAEETAPLINEAIFKLSQQKQVVFRLSRIEGLTHDQIAAQLNISKNTVKNHIVASLKFIRNYLNQR